MYSLFEEFNLFVYYSLLNLFLGFVIWCLGPLADDSREYGLPRLFLAALTRKICRFWLHRRGMISGSA